MKLDKVLCVICFVLFCGPDRAHNTIYSCFTATDRGTNSSSDTLSLVLILFIYFSQGPVSFALLQLYL